MSIYEFLERLDADPFDPALTALFLGNGTEPAQQRQEKDPPQNAVTAADGQALFPWHNKTRKADGIPPPLVQVQPPNRAGAHGKNHK